MAKTKDISQENVEKKFKNVFERSPGAFPEGTSLKEKVEYIKERTDALKAARNAELKSKMENVANLSKKLEKQQKQEDEEIDKLTRSTQELRKEFGINKRSRSGGNDKPLQEAKQGTLITETSTQTDTQPSRVEGLHDNQEFQEAASNLKETTAKGERFGQNGQKKTSEASVKIDPQPSANEEVQTPLESKLQAVSSSVDKGTAKMVDTLRESTAKDKSVEKTSRTHEQTDTQAKTPSKHEVSLSISKGSTKEKSNGKKPEQDEKDNAPKPQEDQEKKVEGLFSLLKRFVKKILEKLLGEDEKSVESAHDTKGDAKKNTPNSGEQQKGMDQSSFIDINGKRFDLEPEKAFNYQDKALNINISITYSNQLRSETEQHLQQGGTSSGVANAINLNINDKEYNVQPGESLNYKGPGLEVTVINGHQQSKNFDKILDQDRSISDGLKQVEKLENVTSNITTVSTPKVDAVNTGRER